MVTNSEQQRVKDFFADPRPYLWNNPYVALRADAVRRLLPLNAGMSVLDLGCGDGRISIPLVEESGDLLLVDSSAAMLELARSNLPPTMAGRVRCECLDLADFESQQTYDVVLCIGVLAHVQNPAEILCRIARLVGPGGRALVQITDDAYRLGRLTHWAGSLSRRFASAPVHSLNHMTLASVCADMQSEGLRFSGSYRYIFVPGLRRLPAAVTRTVVRAVNGPILSRLGGEVLALFQRL
ncbi:MAG TPA: class I SAM-dependent methyltransferase [Steroidobacteraceae bacterium]|jgi:SAM-dependent methyltransferase|nr:class I SAM-dependent methyltransferase [Steroidobacteraceae bacterium]